MALVEGEYAHVQDRKESNGERATGKHGVARDAWPGTIGVPRSPEQEPPPLLGYTLEAIGEQCIVDGKKGWVSDVTRRTGIYARGGDYEPVRVCMYGFVKSLDLQGTGNWSG